MVTIYSTQQSVRIGRWSIICSVWPLGRCQEQINLICNKWSFWPLDQQMVPQVGYSEKNFQATRVVKQIPQLLQIGTEISCNAWRPYLCSISLRCQKYQGICTPQDPDWYSEAWCSLFPSLRTRMKTDPMEELSCTSLETEFQFRSEITTFPVIFCLQANFKVKWSQTVLHNGQMLIL